MKTESKNDVEVLELEFFTDEQMEHLLATDRRAAAAKWCKGTVTNTAAGSGCSGAECAQHMNKTYSYRCDGDKCPIQAKKWYMIPGSCTPGGQKWLSACKVYFGTVDSCK